MELDCAVRLVFQLEGGKQVGHIAVVTDVDAERGLYAELITLPPSEGEEGFWLSKLDRGHAWDWLRDVPFRISYIDAGEEEGDDEELVDGELVHFEARIIGCMLDKFELQAEFQESPPEWASLLEDDWTWYAALHPHGHAPTHAWSWRQHPTQRGGIAPGRTPASARCGMGACSRRRAPGWQARL